MSGFALGRHEIGRGGRTVVIAEIGVNHDGSLARAEQLVRHAADAGADAVKFQLFSARRLMHASTGFAAYQSTTTAAPDPASMLRQYELPPLELARLVALAEDLGLVALATPFSIDDVETIEHLHLPAVKIASPDLVNRPLLERAARLGRPMLVSTGAAHLDEIDYCVSWLTEWGVPFALMHCVSSYPTPAAAAHLAWIAQLAERFHLPVGYSDHTTDLLSGAFAVCAGAVIVERHLTHDRSAEGPDHAASSDPQDLADYIRLIRQAELMRGSGSKRVLNIEQDVRTVSRQSLVLARDIAAGQQLSAADLCVQRPGTGIPAGEFSRAVGWRARGDLRRGTLLQWDMLSDAA